MEQVGNNSCPIEALAGRIRELKLEGPTLFLLESHLPMSNLAHNALLFFAPIASPLLGKDHINSLQHILSDQKHVERLIELIETA